MRHLLLAAIVTFAFWSLTGAGDTSCINQYPDGKFTFPDTCYMTFHSGTTINVTWIGVYKRSNLFYSQFGDDGDSTPIASNQARSWWLWKIPTRGLLPSNLTSPFHFHVVNAQGSLDSQLYGGFWSPGFYIIDLYPSSSTSTFPKPTSTAARAKPTAKVASGPNAKITHAPNKPAATINHHTQHSPAPSDVPSLKLILGVGLGVGIPLFTALVVLAFYFGLRRNRKFSKISQENTRCERSESPPPPWSDTKSSVGLAIAKSTWPNAQELHSTPKMKEMHDNTYHRHELGS